MQERLAVAIRVDYAKDEAILRFHKACENSTLRITSLSKEKSEIEQLISKLQDKFSSELEEAKRVSLLINQSMYIGITTHYTKCIDNKNTNV